VSLSRIDGVQPDGPPPEIRYRRALHLRSEMRELVEARQVIYGLSERDLRSRYSQMALGFLWNVIGPVALTAVIALVLSRAKVEPPFGVPRPVWIYTALMPWTFFAGAVSSGGTSLVTNSALLNKVYVPREVFPISQILNQTVDATCALAAFFVLLIGYQFMPAATFFWFPIPLLIALIFTTAVTILLAGLTVYFRDLRQAIPVLLQLGLFFNPIAWDLSRISEGWQKIYVAVNPLGAAIDGLRQCVLYGQPPDLTLSLIGGTVATIELCLAYLVFKQMEAGFADVA
jgi:ABC-type polysaccharide/polyol phosphate export permease